MSDLVPPSLPVQELPPPFPALPSGTVTFLLTDIVGSTALGNRLGGAAFSDLIQRHHTLLRREFVRSGGREFKEAGDGFWVAFPDARTALCCARDCHQALRELDEPEPGVPLRIRTALFVAELIPDGNDYQGLPLHHAARLLGAAQGGQILLSEAAETLLRHQMPEGMTLRDRGRYRLRDSPAPAPLFEALWPEMPVPETPAPSASPMHTPVLPPVFTRFVGREKEISDIGCLLSEPETPLVTLTGMGGSGKSRLAREAAAAVAPSFEGAVWFVSLADLTDVSRLPQTVAETVGAAPVGDPWDALSAVLASQSSLLVLDNLEQLLIDDDPARRADTFLQRIAEHLPTVTCLATSRHRVGLISEREYPVKPLPVPDAAPGAATPERLGEIGSVALFVDRACRARPDFALTERNAAAVSELCRRLDGIPLALELAAAWARLLTPAEMLAEFKTIRQSRDRNLPARHRSLAAAVEGSYRLLDSDLQRFFRRLSVFRAGWTVAAARSVCDAPDALFLLDELRDSSLLVVEERDGGSRYQFLETLREFAEERLLAEDPTEANAVQVRHTTLFAHIAAEAKEMLKGADQASWLSRMALEHPNFHAALSRATPEVRLQMASNLHRYWMVRGHFVEGRAWITDTLAQNPGEESGITTQTRIDALNIAGALALSAGDFDAAQPLFTECQTLSRAFGDEESDALSRVNLAIIYSQQGKLKKARREYEKSLPLWRRLNRPATLAIVLSNLGSVTMNQHDYEAARTFFEESLLLQEQNKDQDFLLRANTLHNLAEIAHEQKDYQEALQHLNDCLGVRLMLEDKSAIVNLFDLAARLAVANGSARLAAEVYGASAKAAEIAGAKLPPSVQKDMAFRIDALRIQLGAEMFTQAWEKGHTGNWQQMVELVCYAIQQSALSTTLSSSLKGIVS